MRQKKVADVNPLLRYSQADFNFVQHDEENSHCHPPIIGKETKIEIYRQCKRAVLEQKFRPAGELIAGKYGIMLILNKNNVLFIIVIFRFIN